jgi:Kef-type K+ transport system membrane component KefB
MDNLWLTSALWIGLALAASLVSIRVGISVALIEIIVGAAAGNVIDLTPTPWVDYLAVLGAVMLTFLAGAEVDPAALRKHLVPSFAIGLAGFALPFLAVLAYARWVAGWPWPQAQIAGLALSCTSVAVVYAVMIETGYNRTELGKVILAACFINDLGTVAALGMLFANYDRWMLLFIAGTAAALWVLPRFVPWFFKRVGSRISEPETKFVLLLLFLLGGLAAAARSEAVLPAYLVGMVLAPFFLGERVLAQRMRVMAFTLLTPFYFLKAGALVKAEAVVAAFGLILVFLGVKMLAKFGILPITRWCRFGKTEGMYTTLLMCTGLTFGSIAALFGYQNGIISREQYTVLIAAIIASAVVPTLIAQTWFQPRCEVQEEETDRD